MNGNNRGQRIGYIRVSTTDQNEARQLDGVQLDKVFSEKISGTSADRPKLTELMSYARAGDLVLVHSLDRLARNLDDLRKTVSALNAKGVGVEFMKEKLTFTGEDSPMAKLMLSVMGAFAEFERGVIRERQREGIAQAKKRGVYKGRKRKLSGAQVIEARNRIRAGERKATVARELGVSRETLRVRLG